MVENIYDIAQSEFEVIREFCKRHYGMYIVDRTENCVNFTTTYTIKNVFTNDIAFRVISSHNTDSEVLLDALNSMHDELAGKHDKNKIEPVSELLLVTVDISVNEDAPCIKVGKSVGTGCCREIKIVNSITGDEAIELYKKLVGG